MRENVRHIILAIEVKWHDVEQTIVVFYFSTHWRWSDYNQAVKQALILEHSVTHRVDVVADFSRGFSLPMGGVTHIYRAMKSMPPNVERVVIAGANDYARTLVAMMSKPYRKLADKVKLVSTFEDALAFIEEERQAHSAKLA
jgi:hypothetical protein